MVIIPRRAVIRAGHVEQQDEDFTAFDVAQKCMAQADILVRAFNQSRHIANRQPVKVGIFHNADWRMQRGEGIRGDLRTRLGNGREQRGLAGIRIADRPGPSAIGNSGAVPCPPTHADAKRGVWRAAVAKLRFPRPPAPPTENELLTLFRQIGDQFAFSRFNGGKFLCAFPAQINFLRQRATRAAKQWPFARARGKNHAPLTLSLSPARAGREWPKAG